MEPENKSGWEEYRSLWLKGMCVAIGCFLVVTSVNILAEDQTVRNVVIPVAVILWPLAIVWMSLKLQKFPCPRCGKPFFGTKLTGVSMWQKECLYCRLPKWKDGNQETNTGTV